MRLYKSGTNWCVWRWTFVDSEFITRLHLIKTPWFSICLHWLNKPDPTLDLHDHPVSFLSIILRGGYSELRTRNAGQPNLIRHNWFNFVQARPGDQHSIVFTKPHTLTLVLMGPKVREWGYHTPEGWVYWKDFQKQSKAKQ